MNLQRLVSVSEIPDIFDVFKIMDPFLFKILGLQTIALLLCP